MKKQIKEFLQSNGLYHSLKYSLVFRLYQQVFQKQESKQQNREIIFYKSFLPACNLIFDIGAYDGHKTEAFLKISKKVISCEPDKTNFELLGIRFRYKKNRVILENKALGSTTGNVDYYIHAGGSAFNTMSLKFKQIAEQKGQNKWSEVIQYQQVKKVEMTTLDQLIQQYGRPDFIKIDTEGYEAEVIRGLTVPVPFISFECIFPEYENELYQTIDYLEDKWEKKIEYNIAFEEKLQLPSFMNKAAFLQKISAREWPYFEVIARCTLF